MHFDLFLKNHLVFLVPLSISLILTPAIRSVALKFKLVVKPKDERFHRKVTALLGGVGIFFAAVIGIFIFAPLNKNLIVFLFGAAFIFLWGLTDDFKPMKPQIKLLGQIIVSCIVIFYGIYFNIPQNQLLSYVLTIFWIIGITNAFNLLDNMDGLAAGVAVICSFVIYLSSLMLHGDGVGVVALIVAAATLGFLPYNFNPAKIYMGDSGSMFLGFSLSILSLLGSSKHVSNIVATLVVPVLILAVPIFDTLFVIIMRNIRGRDFWVGGKDHTSHRLVTLGLSERNSVILLYIISILFGAVALSYANEKINLAVVSIFTLLTLIVLLFFGIFLAKVETYGKEEDAQLARKKKLMQNKVVLSAVLLYKRHFLELTIDLVLICISYYSAYLLKYDAKIPEAVFPLITQSLAILIILRILSFFAFGLYKRVWEYIGITDLISIFKAVTFSSVINIVILTFLFRFQDYSRVVLIIDWLILLLLISGTRVILPILNEYFFSIRPKEKVILIVGASDTGEMVLREIKRNRLSPYHPIGFVDENKEKIGKKIGGISIFGPFEKIPELVKRFRIAELFIAIPSARKNEISKIISLCKDHNIIYRKISGILDLREEDENA